MARHSSRVLSSYAWILTSASLSPERSWPAPPRTAHSSVRMGSLEVVVVEISVLEDSTVDDSTVEVVLVNVSVVPGLVKVTKVELDTSVEAVVVPVEVSVKISVDDEAKVSDKAKVVSEEEASRVELDASVKYLVVPVEVSVEDATNVSEELKDVPYEVAFEVTLDVREGLGIQGPALAPMVPKATNVTTRDLNTVILSDERETRSGKRRGLTAASFRLFLPL